MPHAPVLTVTLIMGDNYFNADMDYRIAREKSQGINQYVTETLDRLAGTLNVEFITDSRYHK